jgi:DNA-binding transcriptional regulator/RsmH inhibitor MraZ
MVIGVEIGVEIWNLKRWQDELKLINEHELDRGDLELAQDLKLEQ